MLGLMRRTLSLLLAVLLLSACAGGGSYVPYDPNRCDRNGDEHQRRAC
jgi:hypothetical protein